MVILYHFCKSRDLRFMYEDDGAFGMSGVCQGVPNLSGRFEVGLSRFEQRWKSFPLAASIP